MIRLLPRSRCLGRRRDAGAAVKADNPLVASYARAHDSGSGRRSSLGLVRLAPRYVKKLSLISLDNEC